MDPTRPEAPHSAHKIRFWHEPLEGQPETPGQKRWEYLHAGLIVGVVLLYTAFWALP